MNIKQLLLLFLTLNILISCGTSVKTVVNRKIIDREGEPMLFGQITKDALKSPEFSEWYSEEYNNYTPDPKMIRKLKGRARLYYIEIFLGTWSSDTQEQLPRFLKILEESNYPHKKLAMYAVNRRKESFYGEQAQKAITKIPTFIIYKGSREKSRREIGRIIETPTETLEHDLYKIIIEQNK